mgnify:CR=1 FL=1
MSAKDFKFVSPGVFIEEIDNSQLPKSPVAIGPLVIGRARKGPAFQPVRVDSFSEFITIFGNPIAGEEASDLWRDGTPTAPTFAAYAAQAWLKNSTPLTFIRLLGDQHPDAAATDIAKAGWKLDTPDQQTGGGAYGLFLFNSGSEQFDEASTEGTLAAIFYSKDSVLTLSGTIRGASSTKSGEAEFPKFATTTGSSALINSVGASTFTVVANDMAAGVGTQTEKATISFSRSDSNYIRKVLNTNPTLTNTDLVDSTSAKLKKFFLGQTYERAVADILTGSATYGLMLRLGRSSMDVTDGNDFKFATQAAQSGWFFSQDLRNTAADGTPANNTLDPAYNPEDLSTVTRLFKFHGLTAGQETHRNYKISVEDIKYSKNDNTPYGSFSIAIRDIKDIDNAKRIIEKHSNLSLDPNSANYIAKQIGDRYHVWDTDARRLVEYGSYENRSSIVRVEVANAVDQAQTDPELIPFGVDGPITYRGFEVSGSHSLAQCTTGSCVPLGGLGTMTACVQGGASISLPVEPDSGTAATGQIQAVSVTPAQYDGGTLTIKNTAGLEKTYVFDDDGGGATGTLDGSNVRIQVQSLGTAGTIAAQIKDAIESANGHSSTITIAVSTQFGSLDTLTLTQGVVGLTGNNTITRATVTGDGVYTISGFAGSAPALLAADEIILLCEPAFGLYSPTVPDIGLRFTGSISFPTLPLRLSASDGDLSDDTEAYFGVQFARTAGGSTYDEGLADILYPLPVANKFSPSPALGTITSWYFSMDDLVMKEGPAVPQMYYRSGSRADGDSVTARTGSYKAILDKGYDRFTAPMYGGFDGFDITEKEPFNASRALLNDTATPTTYSMFYSAKKAIDMFADPEFIEANILIAPGITNEGLTTHMLQTCESRGDALAIIDPRGGYIPASENEKNEQNRISEGVGLGGVSGHVKEVADNLDARNLNSSYGATYYPWVRISDTISGRQIWAPPSIAAFGAMAYSEKQAARWFAPAGFSRGGLTEGAAGIPVTNVRSRLTSAERDYLYERNVNPIASFPNEGIVIFGQKTLQITPSALDRINVRRLMIFVKKEISRIASTLLFDQNVEQTWGRFTGQVNPFLTNIKNNFGLTSFKVILDETTTTPDMVDRNTIYAQIFLKPTKAVEFFAIDFVITNSGAGFED